MRKILLAATAVAFIGLAGGAQAGGLTDKDALPPAPEPGKPVVRLDVAFWFMAGISSDTQNHVGANKNMGYGFDGLLRFYPQFDAITTGGVKYGAAAELRTNMIGSRAYGNNATANSATGANASARTSGETLYIRRAYGYVGTAQAGTIRFGQIDGVFGLLKTGDNQALGDGGINGDVPDFLPSLSGMWQLPFSVGNEYGSSKFIYLSPNFAGFDLGVSYTPSSQPLLGALSAATAGGNGISASSLPDARAINIIEMNARYKNTFGAVGVAANLGYMTSGRISDGTGSRGLSVVDVGAALTVAGITFGGNLATGRFNGQTNLSFAGEKDALVYVVGVDYDSGPLNLGGHYYHGSRPGAIGNKVQMKDDGLALGAAYVWAPGAKILAEFMTGSENEGASKNHGTALIVAQYFRW